MTFCFEGELFGLMCHGMFIVQCSHNWSICVGVYICIAFGGYVISMLLPCNLRWCIAYRSRCISAMTTRPVCWVGWGVGGGHS